MPDSVAVSQQVWLSCSLGGLTLTNAFAARMNANAARRYMTATMFCSGLPRGVASLQDAMDQEGLIFCGAGGGTGLHDQLRFRGTYKTYEGDLWPNVVQLIFVGRLFEATRTHNPRLELNDPLANTSGRSATDLIEDVGGSDADGVTDEAMIRYLLTVSGVTFTEGDIQGTGRLFGTQDVSPTDAAGNPTGPFIWPAGVSAMTMIERIDQVSVHSDGERAFRTVESLTGRPYRVPTGGRPRGAFDVPQFTEGVDVKSATGGASILDLGNYAIVQGYAPPGGIPVFSTLSAANQFQSGDRHYLAQDGEVTLPMIEFETEDEADGRGMSTELYARFLMSQINRVPKHVSMVTPRDDLIGPLQTHGLLLPHIGITEPLWCQDVTLSVNEQRGSFLQSLQDLGGGGTDPG